MKSNPLGAPENRCSVDRLKKQIKDINELPFLKQGLDATNSMILILNHCRQGVFANKAYLAMVHLQNSSELAGKRSGEIMNCIHACDAITGCGTGDACTYCNFTNTVLQTMATNEEGSGEFSNINTMNGFEQNINFSLHVTPLEVKDEIFSVVTFSDNSDSLRRRILERVFFHDIINTAGALKGILGLLIDDVPAEIKPEVEFVEASFNSLVEEIQMQKYMMDAENRQLVLQLADMETLSELQSMCKLFLGLEVASHKTVTLDSHCINKRVHTDQRLFKRILGNMVKNALEASDEGGVVTLGCSMDDDDNEKITFWVHNDQYMDDQVQNLVFHRSFSTKGAGRGVGTYSMKLFGETFLKGKVGFDTSKEKGTRFYIELPLQFLSSEKIAKI